MIRLEEEAMERIRAEARGAYPEECVGALLGAEKEDVKWISEVVPLENSDANPRRGYTLSPHAYRGLETRAEEGGLTILGFYHSHPDVVDTPSLRDLEKASPFFSYLIVSVWKGEVWSESSWVLREDRTLFDREPIALTNGRP